MFSKLRKIFTKDKSDLSQEQVNRAMYNYMASNSPIWSDQNPESYISQAYDINATVYSIVSWGARKGAQVDFQVEQRIKGKWEEVQDHEALEVLYNPNPMQGKSELFEEYIGFRLLTGNTYLSLLSTDYGLNKGKPQEMYVLPASTVEIVSGGFREPVRGYKLKYGDQNLEFAKEDVLHSKYANYNYDGSGSHLYGMSPIKAGLRVVDKSNENYIASKKSYQNLGAAGLVYDKGVGGNLTPEQSYEVQKRMDKKLKGTDKKGSLVFTQGEWGYINFGLSPVDLNLIKDNQLSREELCNLYHLPVEILNGQKSSGLNDGARKEARKIGMQDFVLPEVQAFCDEWNRKVMPAYGNNLRLAPKTDNIPEMQTDKLEQARWLSISNWLKPEVKAQVQGFATEDVQEFAPFEESKSLSILDPYSYLDESQARHKGNTKHGS
jgi:HK97 family phage portal protein